jgi:antitoxin component YwqK of YwqJK toxin-antitoxin module
MHLGLVVALGAGGCGSPASKAPSAAAVAPSSSAAIAAPAVDRAGLCPPGIASGTDTPPSEGTAVASAWCLDRQGEPEGAFRMTARGHGTHLVVTGQFHAGRPVGTWTESRMDETVTVALQHYDDDGKLDGTNERWTETGKLVLRETFAHGTRVGRYETWYPSGRPKTAGSLAAGPWELDDFRLINLPSVALLSAGRPLKDHKPRNVEASERERAWSAAAGSSFPIGTWQHWNEDGSVAFIRTFDLAGVPDGRFCENAVCTTLNAGTGTLAYSDELGKERFSVRAGRAHGASEAWDRNGKLQYLHTYRNGVLHGPWRELGDYGVGLSVGTYCDGHKCGRWTITGASNERTLEVYDKVGVQLSEEKWSSDGRRVSGWTKADMNYYERGELPPAVLGRLRSRCGERMKTGDCCDYFDGIQPKAIVCRNGPARP